MNAIYCVSNILGAIILVGFAGFLAYGMADITKFGPLGMFSLLFFGILVFGWCTLESRKC